MTDRQLDDDRFAESDLRLRIPIEAGHRDQRVTSADLQAVREMADFAVSEPVQVQDMPSVGLRVDAAIAALPPVGARIRVSDGDVARAGTVVALETTPPACHARVSLDSGNCALINPGGSATITGRRLGRGASSWRLMPDREPPPDPTWQQTAENLRDALALVTKERDEARLARDANAQELASALCSIRRFEKLFDDAGQGEYNVLALVDHYAAQAAAGQDAHRITGELRSLLSVDDAMSPSLVLGQVRQVLGLHEESDAETLDLSGPGIEEGESEHETAAAEDVRTVVAASPMGAICAISMAITQAQAVGDACPGARIWLPVSNEVLDAAAKLSRAIERRDGKTGVRTVTLEESGFELTFHSR